MPSLWLSVMVAVTCTVLLTTIVWHSMILRKQIETSQASLLEEMKAQRRSLQEAEQRVARQMEASKQQSQRLSEQSQRLSENLRVETLAAFRSAVDKLGTEMGAAMKDLNVSIGAMAGSVGEARVQRQFEETYEDVRAKLVADIRDLQEPGDCRSAKYLACQIEHRQCGFGCQLHALTDCMVAAVLARRTAVLLPDRLSQYGPECGHQWECFFLPISSCQAHAAAVERSAWQPFDPHRPHLQYAYYMRWGEDPYRAPDYVKVIESPRFDAAAPKPNAACLISGALLTWVLRPNARLTGAIAARRQQLQMEGVKFDVAVHVRRTDKSSEAQLYDLKLYMVHVDHFVGPTEYHHAAYGRHYGKRILFVSDEDLAHQVKGYDMYTSVVAFSGPQHGRYSRHSLDVLISDLLLMVEPQYFVGTLSSQVSRVVLSMRAAKKGGHNAYKTLASLDEGYYKSVQPRQDSWNFHPVQRARPMTANPVPEPVPPRQPVSVQPPDQRPNLPRHPSPMFRNLNPVATPAQQRPSANPREARGPSSIPVPLRSPNPTPETRDDASQKPPKPHPSPDPHPNPTPPKAPDSNPTPAADPPSPPRNPPHLQGFGRLPDGAHATLSSRFKSITAPNRTQN